MAIRFLKQLAVARCFDLLHNSNLTVPMYADRFELLVFGPLLPSGQHIKNIFRQRIYLGMVMVRTIWLSVSRRSEIAAMPHR